MAGDGDKGWEREDEQEEEKTQKVNDSCGEEEE